MTLFRRHTQPVLPSGHRGFTLIELLVVISIISLLVAILLPALSQARLAAQSTSCMSSMRQLGVTFHMYTQDFDDYFPPHDLNSITDGETTKYMWNWAWMMNRMDYITDRNMLRCPTAMGILNYIGTNGANDVVNHSNPDTPVPFLYIAYGYSNYFLGSSWHMFSASQASTERRQQPARMVDIRKPSECLVVTETAYTQSGALAGSYVLYSNAGYIHELHNNGSNILWVDGHVSHMRDTKIELNRDAKAGPNRNEYYGWY